MPPAAHKGTEIVGANGAVAVVAEVGQRRLERVGRRLVKMKDRQDIPHRQAEQKGRIVPRDQVEDAAKSSASFVE